MMELSPPLCDHIICIKAAATRSAFHPSGVSKWVPALAGKAKAGMTHSACRWSRYNCEIPWWHTPYVSASEVWHTKRRYSKCTPRLFTLPLPYRICIPDLRDATRLLIHKVTHTQVMAPWQVCNLTAAYLHITLCSHPSCCGHLAAV